MKCLLTRIHIGFISLTAPILPKTGVAGTLLKKKKCPFWTQKFIPSLELLFMHKISLIYSSLSAPQELLYLLNIFGLMSYSLAFSQAVASEMAH